MSIIIDSESSLKRVSDYCHDAVFEISEIKYDKDTMVFSLVLTREMWEKIEKEWSFLFLNRWRVPKIKSVLALYNVTSADIRANDVQDTLVDIEYKAGQSLVRLRGMIGSEVYLRIKNLSGTLEDIGQEYFDGTRFTSLGLRP